MTDIYVDIVGDAPATILDNSETVTDYAFMGHRRPNGGVVEPGYRDTTIRYAKTFGYTHYQWTDVNQGNSAGGGAGQRTRFDMLVKADGTVTHLFHTEYFTRVACATGGFCHSYASHYAVVVKDGKPTTDGPLPYCDEHLSMIEREAERSVARSERLFIGQHD